MFGQGELPGFFLLLTLLGGCSQSWGSAAPAAAPLKAGTENSGLKQRDRSSPASLSTTAAPESGPTPLSGNNFRLKVGQAQSLGWGLGEIKLTSFVVESIEASPEDPVAYPSGSGVTMSLLLAGMPIGFSALSEGYDSSTVAYANDFRAELVSYDASEECVVVHLDRVVEEGATILHSALRIQLEERKAVTPGLEIQFLGHGHKRIYSGQTSPLIVYMRYENSGQQIEKQHNLEEPYAWTWQRYKFEIVSSDYGANMVLAVSKLALEPLHPGMSANGP